MPKYWTKVDEAARARMLDWIASRREEIAREIERINREKIMVMTVYTAFQAKCEADE